MSDMDFNKFFDELEEMAQIDLLKKPASQLLRMSASPFDAACIKVKEIESQLSEANKEIEQLQKDKQELQAKIDSLMLEYCPDEMTAEQKENWAKHQKPVSI